MHLVHPSSSALTTVKRRCRGVTVLCVGAMIAASVLGTGSALADPRERKREVDASIAELQESLAGTSRELQSAYSALAETKEKLPGAQAALASAQRTEASAQRKDAELQVRLEAAQRRQQEAADELKESKDEIAATQVAIGRLAGEVYRSGVAAPQMSMALGATSPDDFATRYVLADVVLRSKAGTLSTLNERRAVQANAETRLDAVEVEVADLRAQAAAALAAAEEARAAAAARQAELEALEAAQAQATATIESRKAEEEDRLETLEGERATLQAELRRLAEEARKREEARAREEARNREKARQRESGGSSSGSGSSGKGSSGGSSGGGSSSSGSSGGGSSSARGFARPVDGSITSGFGWRIHPIYGTRRLHAGTDFGASCGTPIRAVASGRVVSAGWAGGYGNRIVIEHGILGGQHIATTYNHMSGYKVRSGSVSRGQVIGYVGTTGASTGCHLHFEVYRNGNAVNPMGYL